jgi:hypothetical protein
VATPNTAASEPNRSLALATTAEVPANADVAALRTPPRNVEEEIEVLVAEADRTTRAVPMRLDTPLGEAEAERTTRAVGVAEELESKIAAPGRTRRPLAPR